MHADPLLARARDVWVGLAGVPVAFQDGEVSVVVSPGSLLCPPGWVGVVVLGEGAVVTVPSQDLVDPVRAQVADRPVSVIVDRLSGLEARGPATLAYLDPAEFSPIEGEVARTDDLAALLAGADPAEADESGLADIQSSAFVVRDGDDVVAAAGYRRWSGGVAHVSVLTATRHRGRGLARAVASAAVADALDQSLLPQWRARLAASRKVAAALGFRELGAQLSVRL